MRAHSFIWLLAVVSLSNLSTAVAKFQDSKQLKTEFRFLGEIHDDAAFSASFKPLIEDALVGDNAFDTIATELIPEELNGEFQEFLRNPDKQRGEFFARLKFADSFRSIAFAKLNALASIKQQHGDKIVVCGIEATSLEHLSEEPIERIALMIKRFSQVPEDLRISAMRTFGLTDLASVVPDWNVDRELKMAANVIACAKGRKAILVHIGWGHAFRENRSTNPGWRTVLDIVEDYIAPSQVSLLSLKITPRR
jgi:hypothetical protein